MANDLDDYDNSKKQVGDWLAGGGGTYVQVIGALLVLGVVVFFLISAFS